MGILTPTVSRVSANTSDAVNREIEWKTQFNINKAREAGPAGIEKRLAELDQEWDIERCLETGAASLTLLGFTLGTTVSRKWLLLSFGVAGFLLQHALQGWCPPLPVLRRLGVRTAEEINQERYALKALRGDFVDVKEGDGADPGTTALSASRH